MPGPFAHLTLVRVLVARICQGRLPGLSAEAAQAASMSTAARDLGALMPDCSYFAVAQPGHGAWGDRIHNRRSRQLLAHAARIVAAQREPLRRRRGLAWALGVASHMVADAVVHPVINRITGGVYSELDAAEQHRHVEYEMRQDVHVYQRLGLGQIGQADLIRLMTRGCSQDQRLDPWLEELWARTLLETFVFDAPAEPPDPALWFAAMTTLLDIADEGRRYLFLRHLGARANKFYVAPEDVAPRYVEQLPTPLGPMDYDAIFERAVAATGALWVDLSRAVAGDPRALDARPDINLDDGRADGVTPWFWSA